MDFLAKVSSAETKTMEAANASYEAFHRDRFRYVLAKAAELCPDKSTRVLDVGRSVLTTKLLGRYDDVTTLGFPLNAHSVDGIEGQGERKLIRGHIVYDLNDAQSLAPVPTSETFELIVFAEVLEHLHTAPELTLFVLKGLLAPGGHLIVQTPNAAALYKRLFLLAGYNPYEKIRINRANPGHFREYTKRELIAYARQVGFDVVGHEFKDYFGTGRRDRLFLYIQKALALVVPSFARGQTLVVRNPCGRGGGKPEGGYDPADRSVSGAGTVSATC